MALNSKDDSRIKSWGTQAQPERPSPQSPRPLLTLLAQGSYRPPGSPDVLLGYWAPSHWAGRGGELVAQP